MFPSLPICLLLFLSSFHSFRAGRRRRSAGSPSPAALGDPGLCQAFCFPPLLLYPRGAVFWGIPIWMHPRLSSGSPLHPSLNSVGIPSGGSPSSIKPEAAGAVSVPAAPLQPSIPSLPPSSSALFTPQAQQRRSHPSCAEFALQMSVPSQLREGSPAPLPPEPGY